MPDQESFPPYNSSGYHTYFLTTMPQICFSTPLPGGFRKNDYRKLLASNLTA
ncbi:hypothetical protein HMPREF9997_00553 [Corynebacterium durum F0235]|uniref:Uncharacterized protein n=1 Tax=Corynebacterium durum F0235 TaxID=1035195 RepID=L1MKF6_9CORY|nr:hypothetical protein HMPREF9997_00553 [Corynebacterium durum F0235]